MRCRCLKKPACRLRQLSRAACMLADTMPILPCWQAPRIYCTSIVSALTAVCALCFSQAKRVRVEPNPCWMRACSMRTGRRRRFLPCMLNRNCRPARSPVAQGRSWQRSTPCLPGSSAKVVMAQCPTARLIQRRLPAKWCRQFRRWSPGALMSSILSWPPLDAFSQAPPAT